MLPSCLAFFLVFSSLSFFVVLNRRGYKRTMMSLLYPFYVAKVVCVYYLFWCEILHSFPDIYMWVVLIKCSFYEILLFCNEIMVLPNSSLQLYFKKKYSKDLLSIISPLLFWSVSFIDFPFWYIDHFIPRFLFLSALFSHYFGIFS